MEADEVIEQLPNPQYAQWRFLLGQNDEVAPNKAEIKGKLMEIIKTNNMAPFYASLCEELKWPIDQGLLGEMTKANEEKIKQLDATIQDAIENLGESEVRDAMQAKADYLTRIGDKEKAASQYRLTLDKTVGSGQKLDIVFTLIRLGLFFDDKDMIERNLDRAKTMVEAGSDWDRKNRLRVYSGIYHMSIREFDKAAALLLEGISTFTAVELLDYQTFIYYTVLMSVVSFDRPKLKDRVLNAPEVLAVVDNIPHLAQFMNSFYACSYAQFFQALAGITDSLKRDRYLHAHAGFYCKELRILAYNQMLASYKSVQLENMAASFGVSVPFLDRELSRFIASGRLHCKIDKVGGIVETTRPDSKNAQYQATIKQGDLLLNRIQKLSRVINL